jgi:mannose-6-phosphate isomerase-like protein (cupin superfamily)
MEAKHVIYSNTKILEINDGVKLSILLRSSDTNGVHAIFEDTVESGAIGPPRHIHHEQDETFLFLEGEFEIEVENVRFQVQAGDVAFVPKGAAHAWKNIGKGRGRFRYFFSPGLNIEDMFQELHDLRSSGKSTEEAMERLIDKYPEQEIVAPPLN